MDIPQFVINLVAGAALGLLGWFARELWGAVQALKRDLEALRVKLAEEYVKRPDFGDAVHGLTKEMRDGFNRIFDKLDGKADKP